jgi:thiol-disulfide isomerase/thioredoxin
MSLTGVRIKAPDFPRERLWLNSQPLTLSELRGKVVLVDIWDYTCINCIRTLPYVTEWYRRYAQYGLVVVGVHTPEFEFAHQKENVEAAVRKYGITYPVVLDNDFKIWSLYANQFWPRKYLLDRDGYIVYDHAGEGDYRETELAIQKYLHQLRPGANFPEPYNAPGTPESGGLCQRTTPELYAGYDRGRLGNCEGYRPGEIVDYRDPGDYMDSHVYASGRWLNREQSLRHARADSNLEDYIALCYHAASVNAVLGGSGFEAYRVYVLQDDAYVAPDEMGEDLSADAMGKTYLEVTESRMYRVVKNREFGQHVLKLFSDSEYFDVYSFTFGSCLPAGEESRP